MIARNWQNIRQLPRFCILVTLHLVRPGLFGGKLSRTVSGMPTQATVGKPTFHILESWKAFVLPPKPYWIGINKPFT